MRSRPTGTTSRMAFWDASAIVPLCCSQAATERGRQLLRDHGRMTVWWGTPVEARSALARLRRETGIDESETRRASELLGKLRLTWDEVQPSEQVRRLAERLPEDYALRSGDAFQLAAALVWCRERPRDQSFVCFDKRLSLSARRAGFNVRGV